MDAWRLEGAGQRAMSTTQVPERKRLALHEPQQGHTSPGGRDVDYGSRHGKRELAQAKDSRVLYQSGPDGSRPARRETGRTPGRGGGRLPPRAGARRSSLAMHQGRVPMVRQHIYLHNVVIQDLPGGWSMTAKRPKRRLGPSCWRRQGCPQPGCTPSARQHGQISLHRDRTPLPGPRLHLPTGRPDPGEALTTVWCTWHEPATPAGAAGRLCEAAPLAAILRADLLLRPVGGPLLTGGDLADADARLIGEAPLSVNIPQSAELQRCILGLRQPKSSTPGDANA
jgi:hypothetical protein